MTPIPENAAAGGPVLAAVDVGGRNEEHFRTDHLRKDLKGRTISSGMVTFGAQLAKFGLTLASTMVLARLLTPNEFGLVGMVTTITNFLWVFKDAGLSIATIQRDKITQAQVSNLFWINLGVGGVCSLAIAMAAPVLAWFFKEPKLAAIAMLVSGTFILSSAAVQHKALLSRQMRFSALAFVEITSMAASFGVGVAMAWRGFSYWSLVGAALALELSNLILAVAVSRWKPSWPSRNSGVRPLLKFGANLSAGSFLYSLSRGADGLLLGRFHGADALGLYSRAAALLMRPVEQFISPIAAVVVPTLSRLVSEPERYRRTFLAAFEALALVWFPFTAMLLAVSQPMTLLLLGSKWGEAGVIFAGFTLAALYAPLASAATWLLHSQARGGDLLRTQTILSLFTVASFIAGLPFGPLGVALAFSVSGLLIRLPILYYFAGRSGPVTALDLWKAFFRHVPSWLIVFVATGFATEQLSDASAGINLAISILVGLGSAVVCASLFPAQRNTALALIKTARDFAGRKTVSVPPGA